MTEPLRYEIDLTQRDQHLVTVTLTVPGELSSGARLYLPTWTPGSYFMRDYVHHLQTITAADADGPVPLELAGHTGWQVTDDVTGPLTVVYELYANELTVRTNHVDDHHALLVGAATFVLVEGARNHPHEVRVHATTGDRVWALLPGDGDRYRADDADHLVDSAFEVGDFPSATCDVRGVPHHVVWAGHGGAPDLDRITRDLAKMAEAGIDLFDGDLPVDEYTFLCVGWDEGGGGLEHRDGAVLMMPVTTFQDADTYARFQSLMAHEYLHLWNVKRLAPQELTEPDLVGHTHSRLLWVAEGWTAYYDELLPVRAGVWDLDRFLKTLGRQLDVVLDRPGAAYQSLEESSYHAWTKQYVRDENSLNTGVDYYGHGAVVAWCLDLLIRRSRPGSRGLDEALRSLWQQFGTSGAGFTDDDVRKAVSAASGEDLAGFFDRHVRGRELPPIEDLVEVVGLQVTRPTPDEGAAPWFGAEVAETDSGVTATAVYRDGPAWSAGLTGDDELLAIDGQAIKRGQLDGVLRRYEPDATIEVVVRRGPRVLTRTVTLADPRPPRKVVPVDDPTTAQAAAFTAWTGQPHPADTAT
jgi:predicted metalloprotease with PDZ domain